MQMPNKHGVTIKTRAENWVRLRGPIAGFLASKMATNHMNLHDFSYALA